MPGLTVIAKEVGAHPIRCPHCGGHFKINRVLEMFFLAIMKLVRDGRKVSIRNFGTFSCRLLPGREMNNPFDGMKRIKFGDRLILAFHQSQAAKRFMNRDLKRGPLTRKKENDQ